MTTKTSITTIDDGNGQSVSIFEDKYLYFIFRGKRLSEIMQLLIFRYPKPFSAYPEIFLGHKKLIMVTINHFTSQIINYGHKKLF